MFFQEYFVFCDLSFRQHWAVFCRLENGEPLGVTVHSHCLEDLLQRYVSEVGLRWIVKKPQFFLNTLYLTSQLVLHTLRMARIWHFGSTSTGYFVHLLVCPSDMKISSLSATEHRSSGRVFIFTKSVNTNRLTPQTFRPINCYSNGYVL